MARTRSFSGSQRNLRQTNDTLLYTWRKKNLTKKTGKTRKTGKKGEASSGGGGGETAGKWLAEITGIALGLYLLFRWISAARTAIETRGTGVSSSFLSKISSVLFYGLASFILFFTIFSNILSSVLLMGIIYAVIRINEITREIHERLNIASRGVVEPDIPREWQRIIDHITSDNPSDWRLAILEADIVLDEVLAGVGFVGDTLGDKLKQAEKGDFKTIENAWEAHKIRNAIAHEGADFTLTQREARRIIDLYQSVFEEFKYI